MMRYLLLHCQHENPPPQPKPVAPTIEGIISRQLALHPAEIPVEMEGFGNNFLSFRKVFFTAIVLRIIIIKGLMSWILLSLQSQHHAQAYLT